MLTRRCHEDPQGNGWARIALRDSWNCDQSRDHGEAERY